MKKENTTFAQLPDLLTMEDLAALFGVSQLMAYSMLHSGSLPTTMVGKRTVVPKKAFIQWLDGKFKSPVGSK